MDLRNTLAELYDEEILLMDPASQFDKCIVGIGHRCGMEPVAVYDTDLVIRAYIDGGMSPEEAIEFFEFNAAGAWLGERTPIFMTRIDSIFP